MSSIQNALKAENPAEVLADPAKLLEFVSREKSLGVKVIAMARKLGVSRTWFYIKLAEAQQLANEKAPSPTREGPSDSIPETGSNTISSDNTASAMPGESAHGGSST